MVVMLFKQTARWTKRPKPSVMFFFFPVMIILRDPFISLMPKGLHSPFDS